ncbi:MAG TPA: hypothetical protein VEL74_01760, partial [Thermoanaerobaculia bacterium]|nr:hypothetical protein [Thermoanaerobaculia bacterium]
GPLDNAYKEHLSEGRTSLFDTHPADRERITKSLGGPPQGVFACALPASVVFSDFASLERRVSRDLFQAFLGRELPDDAFVPAEKAVAAFAESQQDSAAAERYLPGGVSLLHPLPLPGVLPAPPVDPLPALTGAVGSMEVGRKDAVAILERYSEIYNQRSQANRAGSLLAYGVPIDAASFGLSGPKGGERNAVREAQSATTAQLEELARRLEPLQAAAAHRLTLALSLLPGVAGRLEEGAAWQEQVPRLLDAAARLREVLPLLLDLQDTRALLAMVGSLEDREGQLAGTLTELTRSGQTRLREMLASLEGAADPFPEEPIPLARLAAPDGVPAAEPAPVYHAIGGTSALFDLYGRILGRLCRIAEGVEAAVAPRG